MTKRMAGSSWLGSWGASLLLLAAFCLFSPLSMLAVNAPRGARAWKFLVAAVAVFVLAVSATLIFARWTGRARATGVMCAFLFVFFSWSALLDLGQRASVGVTFAVGFLSLFVWAGWRYGQSDAFQISMAAVGIGLLAIPVPGLLAWYTSKSVEIVFAPDIAGLATSEGPDVYLIILDGYGRADILSDVFGYTNAPFIAELERRGFQVPEGSHANYSATDSSISSTLAMDYLVAPGPTPSYRFVRALNEVIGGSNPAVRTLKDSGYHYSHIESGWDGSRCGSEVDTCYGAAFLDEAVWTLVGRTPFARVAESLFGHAFALNGLRSLNALAKEASTERSAPRFVFGHIILPHPPLALDEFCRVRSEPQPGGGRVGSRLLVGSDQLDDRRAGYVEQVKCVNSRILRFLDELDEDVVVFITGDHGPDSFGQTELDPTEWTAADIEERLTVFSAYRLPVGCSTGLPAQPDLINGMRVVLGCVIQEELAKLPVHSYISPMPNGPPYPTTEVDTGILGG